MHSRALHFHSALRLTEPEELAAGTTEVAQGMKSGKIDIASRAQTCLLLKLSKGLLGFGVPAAVDRAWIKAEPCQSALDRSHLVGTDIEWCASALKLLAGACLLLHLP